MSADDDLSDDYKRATFDLIVSLRGGIPETCDFCQRPYVDGRYPVPEEAGEWACNECVRAWETKP